MLNRKEVTALKKVIKAITAKKVNRNFWMQDDEGYTCFGMDYFFVRLKTEDTGLLQKSGKDLLKIINRLSDEKLVYVNNKFDFGLEDYNISVKSGDQENYNITLYEKGGLQIYVLPIRVQEKNKFLK